MKMPAAWRVVKTSGDIIFVSHKNISSQIKHEFNRKDGFIYEDTTVDAVRALYKLQDVTPLYEDEY
jgi:threonine synthase